MIIFGYGTSLRNFFSFRNVKLNSVDLDFSGIVLVGELREEDKVHDYHLIISKIKVCTT